MRAAKSFLHNSRGDLPLLSGLGSKPLTHFPLWHSAAAESGGDAHGELASGQDTGTGGVSYSTGDAGRAAPVRALSIGSPARLRPPAVCSVLSFLRFPAPLHPPGTGGGDKLWAAAVARHAVVAVQRERVAGAVSRWVRAPDSHPECTRPSRALRISNHRAARHWKNLDRL